MKRVTILLPGDHQIAILQEMLSSCGGLLESIPLARDHNLTRTEMNLLGYLAARPGQVVSRQELLEEIWGLQPSTDTRTVDAHMAALRRKLEANARRPVHLLTVRGRGYSFVP